MTTNQYWIDRVHEVREYAQAVASEWNGDEAGLMEDRAMTAKDIMDLCNETVQKLMLLEEMDK